jgi:hypothetical protein
MKRSAFAVLAAVALLAAGCSFFPAIEGSGFPRMMSYNYANFSRVTIEHPFKVRIVPDTKFSVSVTCDDNIVPYLVVENVFDTVKVSLQNGYNYRQVILAAEIHMPALSSLSLSGASEARVESGFASSAPLRISVSGASTADLSAIACGSLNVDVSGASSLAIPNLSTNALSANVSGASSLSAQGSAGAEALNVSGASSAQLAYCAATQANVTLSGASKGWVNVGAGQIVLSVSGASTLYIMGNPLFVINELSGLSTVTRM